MRWNSPQTSYSKPLTAQYFVKKNKKVDKVRELFYIRYNKQIQDVWELDQMTSERRVITMRPTGCLHQGCQRHTSTRGPHQQHNSSWMAIWKKNCTKKTYMYTKRWTSAEIIIIKKVSLRFAETMHGWPPEEGRMVTRLRTKGLSTNNVNNALPIQLNWDQ